MIFNGHSPEKQPNILRKKIEQLINEKLDIDKLCVNLDMNSNRLEYVKETNTIFVKPYSQSNKVGKYYDYQKFIYQYSHEYVHIYCNNSLAYCHENEIFWIEEEILCEAMSFLILKEMGEQLYLNNSIAEYKESLDIGDNRMDKYLQHLKRRRSSPKVTLQEVLDLYQSEYDLIKRIKSMREKESA
ncbi:MAG: hypothetical protein FWE02_02875 [Defluviitaleaceae bacterium]|nr:hypothetical protein [Defluviitaleaceae bacterium]